jgi:hypothetical protein
MVFIKMAMLTDDIWAIKRFYKVEGVLGKL